MASVAEQLRSARESRQLTIAQVAEITKIRGDHLRALEEGNYDPFVAPVYIRGFVRTYATLLKLEVPKIMGELEGELNRTEKFREPPPLSREPRGALDFLMLQLSRISWRKSVALLAVVGLVGLVLLVAWAWREWQSRDPLEGLPPAVYRPASSNSNDTLPLPNPAPAPAPRRQ